MHPTAGAAAPARTHAPNGLVPFSVKAASFARSCCLQLLRLVQVPCYKALPAATLTAGAEPWM